jgi:hypothetical protein
VDYIKKNARLITAGLLAVGVIVLAANNGNDNSNQNGGDQPQEQASTQTEDAKSESADAMEKKTDDAQQAIGSEPAAGTVMVKNEDNVYSSEVRMGDNQTVIVRQMVDDHLRVADKKLSAEQRLYMETVLVNGLPRNNVVQPGDQIKVERAALEKVALEAEALDSSALARWSRYL